MKRWGIIETLAAMVVLMVGYVIYLENTRPHGAVGTTCLSNIKQVDLAMIMYAGDFDERLPARDWSLQLRPYARNRDIETCPLVGREKRQNGYALNLSVAVIDITKVKDPSMEVTLFETDALGPGVIANLAARNDHRHNGKSGVGYLDGHAKSIAKGAPLKGAP